MLCLVLSCLCNYLNDGYMRMSMLKRTRCLVQFVKFNVTTLSSRPLYRSMMRYRMVNLRAENAFGFVAYVVVSYHTLNYSL